MAGGSLFHFFVLLFIGIVAGKTLGLEQLSIFIALAFAVVLLIQNGANHLYPDDPFGAEAVGVFTTGPAVGTLMLFFVSDGLFSELLLVGLSMTVSIGLFVPLALASSMSLHISAKRAVLSSILAIIFIVIIVPDSVLSFWKDLQAFGLAIFFVLFINILADSISIHETLFLLRFSRGQSVLGQLTLVVLDIILSAFIFLALPFASGDLPVFLDALRFTGSRPWLGVLFWATFATSIVFYLFVLSSICLAFVHLFFERFVKLDTILDITDKPFQSLGLTASILTIFLSLLDYAFRIESVR